MNPLDYIQQPYRIQPQPYQQFIGPSPLLPRSLPGRPEQFIYHRPQLEPRKDSEPWFVPLLVERFEQEYNTEISILGGKRKGKSSLALRIAEKYARAMGRPVCECKPTVKFQECGTRVKRLVEGRILRLRCRALDGNSDSIVARAHADETRHRIEPPTFKPWKEEPCERVVVWVQDHVFYKNEGFFLKAPDMPLGDLALFDESGVTHDAHRWQERRSRLFREMSEIWGKWRFVVMYMAPDSAYIQKSEKLGLNCYIIVWQRQYARVYGLKKDYLGGQDTRWRDSDGRERILQGWPMPQTPGLWREYNRVKDTFMGDTLINALAMEGTEMPPGWLEKVTRREEDIEYVK